MSTRPCIPVEDFSARAERFVALHRAQPVRRLIGNVDAEVEALRLGGASLPVTVNAPGHGNAWICSPQTTYGDYALEEIHRFGHPWLAKPLSGIARAAVLGMRHARLDAAVSVNNWLVSTNSYPDLDAPAIRAIAAAARERWPDHGIWFRSLNPVHNADWLHALQQAGAVLVASRQVYLFDDPAALAGRHADLRKDLRLLRRSRMLELPADKLSEADYSRIAELYAMLYLQRYSRLNPDYSAALIRAWHRDGLLRLHGVRGDDGILQGAVGLLRFGDLITSPIVGYDTALPQRLGLYRLLAATVLEQAAATGCQVNLSAGVGHFKRQRGGVATIEYSAVIVDHLPARSRAALQALSAITRRIGVPIMRHYRL